MLNNPFWCIPPFLPQDNNEPPTIYSLLESIVNYGKEDKVKISDLASYGRSTFFDFSYPLTDKISKEDFETMILNYYMMRRIGYETVTAFKMQLNVKLNMIMPKYNMMFDSIANWDLFKDGKKITRNISRNENGTNNNTNSLTNNSGTTTNSSNKRSDLPQSELSNLDDNKYVTNYERDNNTLTSNSTASGTNNNTYNNSVATNDVIQYTQNDLVKLYEQFQNNINNVYSLIFKDLDSLFYSLI